MEDYCDCDSRQEHESFNYDSPYQHKGPPNPPHPYD